MISPQAFGRTHKRRVADVIRVALERKGVIGFIDTHESMSLLEARALINENVENAPREFQFVLEDGVPVSARQESSQKISYFYPCVKIRECSSNSRVNNKPGQSSVGYTSPDDVGSAGESPSSSGGGNGTTEKITVRCASREEFSAWISEDYTFQQLRKDASRYWSLPAAQVALTDADGCLWPEQAKILSVMSIDELHRKKVVLEYKGGNAGGLGSTMGTARTKQLARTQSATFSRTASFRPTLGKCGGISGATGSPSKTVCPTSSSSAATSSLLNPVEELWLIFTFYCVNGDSLELECIKAHQFNKMLRDSRLFGGSLTPAIADIIYTSETKGKPHASGKMSYDEFLNALMKISTTKHKQSSRQLPREPHEEEQLFQRLVLESILPLASRWPTNVWDVHTQCLRKPEIVSFISKFLEPLLEIFMFYARSHLVNPTSSIKEFYMSYADYQRFFNDFCFANLQLSSVDAAQIFLASCSSSPFHTALFGSGENSHSQNALDSTTGVDSGSAAIQRILGNVEGIVTYAFPEMQIGRMCMGVSAFLDALGRTGLTAFSKVKAIKTLYCVKAIFHHLSRGLTRSRVQEILHNHSSTSIHATKFYSGTVAFNNKFLDMWRYEGSPDYLAGSIYSFSGGKDKVGSGGGGGGAAAGGNTEVLMGSVPTGLASIGGGCGGLGTPVASPARRLMMTSSMFEDRIISSGAGRGREALDRLVRNAFLRNAVDTVNAADAQLRTNSAASRLEAGSNLGSEGIAELYPEIGMPVHLELGSPRTQFNELSLDTGDLNAHGGHVSSVEKTEKALSPRHDAVRHLNAISVTCDTGAGDGLAATEVPRPHSPVNAHMQVRPMFAGPSSPTSPSGGGGCLSHAPPPLRREDERVLFESILLKGGVFKKYGQWGNPHRRYVWCSKDFDAVFWRPLNRKNNLSKEGVAVAGIIAVLPGNSTRTRYAFVKHLSDGE